MRASSALALGLVALAGGLPPAGARAQGIVVDLYPREVVRDRAHAAVVQRLPEGARAKVDLWTMDADAIARIAGLSSDSVARLRTAAFDAETRTGWKPLSNAEAGRIWRSPSLLPGASVSPGTDRTAVYTELGSALSGGWRFVLGTALAVKTGGEEQDEAAAAQEDATDTDAGFRRFIAGGGNLSLGAMRPLALRSGTFSNHVIVAAPRVWSNIPSLGDADAVDDFGGEIAAEYQYLRYERNMASDTMPERAFLVLQLRTGLVAGTNSFYRTVGRENGHAFGYTVPTLSLSFGNGVRVGVSYFYAFGAFSDHESLRFHVNLSPAK